jgi:hypothetical protein
MPSTYTRIAVDFDGDGRRDLVGSVADALASTAHYLKRSGWRSAQVWGFEVALPEGFKAGRRTQGHRTRVDLAGARSAPHRRKRAGECVDARGAQRRAAAAGGCGRPGLPRVPQLRGAVQLQRRRELRTGDRAPRRPDQRRRGIRRAWPTDDAGLSRAQRRELQTLLIARGHDIGEVDGRLGTRSREAIKAEQSRLGWETDGRAGQKLLDALRTP